MQILHPYEDGKFTPLTNCTNAIFLAGPCPRTTDKHWFDWREDAISILDDLGFDGTILNPTNDQYDETDPKYLEKQTRWESEAMKKASAIIFWIDRSEEHPGLTTNIEFGEWLGKTGVYIGWPNTATKNSYLQVKCDLCGVKHYSDLKSICAQVLKDLARPATSWFISDTHFGQERTLELSRRPFRTVEKMDLTMISNWNKNVRMQDTVYFLGDFGNYDQNLSYLKLLNFNKLVFILGNYDRENIEIVEAAIESYANRNIIELHESNSVKIALPDWKEVVLLHEPLMLPEDVDNMPYTDDTVYLYGHIHGRTLYKRNGTDVGVDTNNFTPLSQEDVLWRLNALKYFDDNVWTDICKPMEEE